MNDQLLAYLTERHTEAPSYGREPSICTYCEQPWPCDVAQLCAEVWQLRGKVNRLTNTFAVGDVVIVDSPQPLLHGRRGTVVSLRYPYEREQKIRVRLDGEYGISSLPDTMLRKVEESQP